MTPKALEAEIERDPFVPVRIHLSSGKVIDVYYSGDLMYLSYGLMVFRRPNPASKYAEGYDMVNYRLIERVEPIKNGNGRKPRRRKS